MADKLLMDKAWERIQKKTFTKWVNSHLAKRGQKIDLENGLVNDFEDGLLLISFMEIISNKKPFTRFEKTPKMRIQKLQNVQMCLKFIESEGVKLTAIGAEDLVDKNLKLWLGFIWTIIQKYSIQDISEDDLNAKEALLLWCKKKTKGYKGVDPPGISNFHTSFQDGLALCALIHKHRPDLIDYDSLSKADPKKNLNLAFEIAEKEFGIPSLLDADDMVDVVRPDEKSVMTYVALYYHYFASGRKNENAARRIGKMLEFQKQMEELMNDYNRRAKAFNEWEDKKTEYMVDRNFPNEISGIEKLLEDLLDYKKTEKEDQNKEKGDLESLHNTIQLKLRSNNRPPFVPPEGLDPTSLDNKWDKLGEEEREREAALRRALERLKDLKNKGDQFDNKAKKLEAWIKKADDYSQKDEPISTLGEANSALKNHEEWNNDYDNSKSNLKQLQEIADSLKKNEAPNSKEIGDRIDKITKDHSGLENKFNEKEKALRKKLEIEELKEGLRINWAQQVKLYNKWAGDTIEEVASTEFGNDLESVEKYEQEMKKDDERIKQASTEKKTELKKIWDQIVQLGIADDLKYTVLVWDDVEKRDKTVLDSLEERHKAYQEELQRQKLMEEKRKHFAKLADDFVNQLVSRFKEISGLQGEPEDLISKITENYAESNPEKLKLQEITALRQEMSELGINENKHTPHNVTSLNSKLRNYQNQVKNLLSSLGEEAVLKKAYNEKASEIVEAINEALPYLQKTEFDNTLVGAQEEKLKLQNWHTTKKAETAAKRPEIAVLYDKVSKSLKAKNRPAWVPTNGRSLEEIEKQWNQLEEAEKLKERLINEELERQEKIDKLVKRFNSEAGELEEFFKAKKPYAAEKPEIGSLFNAQLQLTLFDAFKKELDLRVKLVGDLRALKGEIESLNYKEIDELNKRASAIDNEKDEVSKSADEKGKYLQDQLEKQQKGEGIRQEYELKANDFLQWVKTTLEDIDDTHFGSSQDEVEKFKTDLDASDKKIRDESGNQVGALKNLAQQLADAKVTDVKPVLSDLEQSASKVEEELKSRGKRYEDELQKQKDQNVQRKKFADAAQEFIDYLSNSKKNIESTTGKPLERVEQIEKIWGEGKEAEQKLEALKEISAQMRSAGIFTNHLTSHTLPSLSSKTKQFNNFARGLITSLKEEDDLKNKIKSQKEKQKEQEEKEHAKVEYNKKAKALNVWLESAEDVLEEPVDVNSVSDVNKLQDALNKVTTTHTEKASDLETLKKDFAALAEKGVTPSTPVTDIEEKYNSVTKQAHERKETLGKEEQNQKEIDQICKNYQESSHALSNAIKKDKESLSKQSGSLDQQLESITQSSAQLQERKKELVSVENVHNQAVLKSVSDSRLGGTAFKDLTALLFDLENAIEKTKNTINKEISARKDSDITPEQLNEFQETFKAFDRDNSGNLNKSELKAGLTSMGDDISEEELEAEWKLLDPNNTGKIGLDTFTKFMINRNKDTDTDDQMLESFKIMANDKEFIEEKDLRSVMDNDQVNHLLKAMPKHSSGNGYDYKAYVASIYKKN